MRILTLFLLVFILGCSISIEWHKQNENKLKVYELEKLKLIEVYNHNKEIYDIIKKIYDKNEKVISTYQLKEMELKLKLSEIDIKIKELELAH